MHFLLFYFMVFHCRDSELHLPNGTRQIKIQVEIFSENKTIQTRLSLMVRVNVVLNRTVVVDSD